MNHNVPAHPSSGCVFLPLPDRVGAPGDAGLRFDGVFGSRRNPTACLAGWRIRTKSNVRANRKLLLALTRRIAPVGRDLAAPVPQRDHEYPRDPLVRSVGEWARARPRFRSVQSPRPSLPNIAIGARYRGPSSSRPARPAGAAPRLGRARRAAELFWHCTGPRCHQAHGTIGRHRSSRMLSHAPWLAILSRGKAVASGT